MRARGIVAALLAVVLAGAGPVWLVSRGTPIYDEFYSLAYVHAGSLGQAWHLYRGTRDAAPPLYYGFSWLVGKGFGGSLVALRIPSVLAWMGAAACLAVYLRRLHPAAVFVGALVPTASAQVALGAYDRSYAAMFLALAVALVAWQRSFEAPQTRTAPVVFGAAVGAAILLHPSALAPVVVILGITFAGRRSAPGAARQVLVTGAAGCAAIALPVVLLERSVRVQSATAEPMTWRYVPDFYLSTARPAVLLVLSAVAAATWLLTRERAATALTAATATGVDLRLAAALVLVVPTLAVLGMWATSGMWDHRYAIGALLGAAIIAGSVTDRVASRSRVLAAVIVAAMLVSLPLAAARGSVDAPSHRRIESILTSLRLPPRRPVVFVVEYDYLLAHYDTRGASRGLMRVARPAYAPGIAPVTVDLARFVDAASGPVDIVGGPADISALAAQHHWRLVVVARAGSLDGGSGKSTEHALVTRR